MSVIKKAIIGISLLSILGCANKSYLAREYDDNLTLNITANEVITKLSKDFNVEIENVTETVKEKIETKAQRFPVQGGYLGSTQIIKTENIKKTIFIFRHKQLKDYIVLVFAKDENAKVNLIEISNYMNFAPTNMNAEDRLNHYLATTQLERVKKDFSFLPCANNTDFLKTDNLCENNYVVSDDSYDSGGFISLILIEPVKK